VQHPRRIGLLRATLLVSIALAGCEEQTVEDSAMTAKPSSKTTALRGGDVRREEDKVWIDNVPYLAFGKNGDTTFAGALETALSVTDHPYTYEQIMGYSGLAFRFRWAPRGKGWCGSIPVGEFPEEKAAVCWATGWQLHDEDNMANEDDPHMERFAQDMVASIDAGLPVVGYGPNFNCAVAFGYQNNGEAFLWWDYFAGDTPAVLPAEKTGPWLWFLKGFSEPPARREQLQAALKIAVRNWDRELTANPKDDEYLYLWGDQAFTAWAADVRDADTFTDEQRESLLFSNWWCFSVLAGARGSAVTFLREYADAAGSDKAAKHLAKAVTIYAEAGEMFGGAFGDQDAFLGPWTGKQLADWTDEVRQREIEIITKAHELDRQAIAEIEAALAAME